MASALACGSHVTFCIRNARAYATASATSSTTAKAAAESAVSTPPLMWRLTHGIFDADTSMSEKFPGIPEPRTIAPPRRSAVEISTLGNGVRVASQDLGGPVSAVGLFINAGSRYEGPHNQGVSHLIDQLAYKGTKSRSKFKMTRDMEKTGASFNSSVTRESMSLFGETVRGSLGNVVNIIAESALRPAAAIHDPNEDPIHNDLATAEVKLQTGLMRAQLEELRKDPMTVVMEAVHAAAFEGNTLGLPMLAEERKLKLLTPQTVAEYIDTFFTPKRIVLSGTNVSHEELVRMAENEFDSPSTESEVVNVQAKYTGGSSKITGDGGAHIAIGFKGASWTDKDLVPVCVLAALLGGGGSFSSGGPGKGMYTRLYTEILNRHGWVSSALAFNECYSDAGIFGIQASTPDPAQLNNLVEVVSSQISKLASAPTKEELARAKAMQKTSLMMNLESRLVVCEDIGRQVASNGKYRTPDELIKAIDAVTADDVRRAASRMLDSKPTVVMYGDAYETYNYDTISSSIKSQARLTG